MKKRKKVRNQAVLGLRQILGVTQREFALLVGASLDLIKGVESGRNKLSRALARRIFMATGAEPSALVKYDEIRGILFIGGEKFTKELYDDWNARLFPNNEKAAWEFFENIIAPHMLLLLLAATKVKNRLNALVESWAEWETETVKHFDLVPHANSILKKFPVPNEQTLPWGDWRKAVKMEEEQYKLWVKSNPGKTPSFVPDMTKKWWGFVDDPVKKDTELHTRKVSYPYSFLPGLFGFAGLQKMMEKSKGNITN